MDAHRAEIQRFADKGYKVTGIDLSGKMIAAAKKLAKNADFKVMDMMKLNFKNDSFDSVWASGSLIHIKKKDIPKAIIESHRVLKKDGVFYLNFKKGRGELMLPDKRYNGVMKFWSFFQKKEIEGILKKNGFEVIKSYLSNPIKPYQTHHWIRIFAKKN